MLSAQSTVSSILKNPEAVAILEEYLPGASTDPKLGMAKMLTLEKISKLTPDLSPEILEKIDERLKALGD
jgi:hypothetical protein